MLILKKDMLLPEGVPESLIDFMDEARDVSTEGVCYHSKIRWIIILSTDNKRHIYEGYLAFHQGGELRVRSNTSCNSRSIHLYAWDNVIAMVPCNKRLKKCWLHPDIEERMNVLDSLDTYYRNYYKERVDEYIENSRLAG